MKTEILPRIERALARGGLTVAEARWLTNEELRRVKGIGPKGVHDFRLVYPRLSEEQMDALLNAITLPIGELMAKNRFSSPQLSKERMDELLRDLARQIWTKVEKVIE